jgi:dienelactone hydrolase
MPVRTWASIEDDNPLEYRTSGSGPTLIAFDRAPAGYYDRLTDRYRAVVMNYPPPMMSQALADSFTVDRVCTDILAVADRVAADRFAWYGFSWGGVVGLQLAIRTNRLTALVVGGWPPLGGQYRETLAVTEIGASRGGGNHYATFYRSFRDWSERDAVAKITCPRMTFVGTKDEFVAEGYSIRHGPLIAAHRVELEKMGWTVRLVEGFGHELGARPDVVIPVVREFLDPILR